MTSSPYDVVIIGAGLAGTCAAHAIAAAGRTVALLDTHAVYPSDFRAEKLGNEQMEQFDRLGLGSVARDTTTPVDQIWVARFQRLVSRRKVREYGLHYADLVNGLRSALNAKVPVTIGRVAEIETGPELQAVVLNDGRRLEGRLIVLTTGLGDALRRKAGISRTVLSRQHSLCFGFDLAAPPSAFPFPSLICYGDALDRRIAYGTLFPIRDTMRVNLFTYHDLGDPWVKTLREQPEAALRTALPWLAQHCQSLAVKGPVEMRPIDIVRAENHRRDGIVLLGDAFLSPCPIPGTGIGKVLTDVERLTAVHLPRWLEGRTMDRATIETFYDDSVKVASDARCVRASLYARSIATDHGPVWMARRARNFVARHLLHGLDRLRDAFRAPIGGGRTVRPT